MMPECESIVAASNYVMRLALQAILVFTYVCVHINSESMCTHLHPGLLLDGTEISFLDVAVAGSPWLPSDW